MIVVFSETHFLLFSKLYISSQHSSSKDFQLCNIKPKGLDSFYTLNCSPARNKTRVYSHAGSFVGLYLYSALFSKQGMISDTAHILSKQDSLLIVMRKYSRFNNIV